MKPKKRIKASAKKNEKKKINYKPVIAVILIILALAALYALFVALGIELGKLVGKSAVEFCCGGIL